MNQSDRARKPVIFLLGFMGAGKSTLGSMVAQSLDLPFVDLDSFLEYEENMSIEEIFRSKGEAYFRGCEAFYLRLVIAKYEDGAIIATGGGAPCHSNNLELMKKSGLTIYLKASADSLADRLSTSHSVRPLIEGKSKEEVNRFVRDLLGFRESFYERSDILFSLDTNQDKKINASMLEKVVREEIKTSL